MGYRRDLPTTAIFIVCIPLVLDQIGPEIYPKVCYLACYALRRGNVLTSLVSGKYSKIVILPASVPTTQ